MQHASLTSFLNGERSANTLWREIEPEVSDCLAACAKGGAGPVIISHGPRSNVTRGQMAVLITALAEAELPMEAASYIADALIMSDSFAWEDAGIAEAISRLSDESAPLTKSDLEWAMRQITRPL